MVINTFHRQPFLVFLELPAITESVGLNVVEYEYLLLHFVFLVNIYNKYDCTRKQSSSAKSNELNSVHWFYFFVTGIVRVPELELEMISISGISTAVGNVRSWSYRGSQGCTHFSAKSNINFFININIAKGVLTGQILDCRCWCRLVCASLWGW